MSDYIKKNSKRYCNNTAYKFQSYNALTFGENIKMYLPNQCKLQKNCNINYNNYNKYVNNQQNLYAKMRHQPNSFPIIPLVDKMNLTQSEKRAYSNNWYKQFGTSQARPVNDNWGGFYLVGSEVPYTN